MKLVTFTPTEIITLQQIPNDILSERTLEDCKPLLKALRCPECKKPFSYAFLYLASTKDYKTPLTKAEIKRIKEIIKKDPTIKDTYQVNAKMQCIRADCKSDKPEYYRLME